MHFGKLPANSILPYSKTEDLLQFEVAHSIFIILVV